MFLQTTAGQARDTRWSRAFGASFALVFTAGRDIKQALREAGNIFAFWPERGKFMTEIYLIRHAEAEGNIYRRAHGAYDGRVSPKGRRQIEALAERFRGVHIDALYSSGLIRTRQTAGAVLAAHELPLLTEPGLREIDMGPWEDRPWGNLTYLYPEAMAAFNNDPERWQVPGAETFQETRRRMMDTVAGLAARHPGQTVACVSHGTAIRALVSGLLGVPSREIYRVPHGDNTSVTLLRAENGGISVEYFNDNSHLTPELSTFSRQSWWRSSGSTDDGNLRFEPLDPNAEPELYVGMYEKAWLSVHGVHDGFDGAYYLERAKRHFQANGQAVVKAIKAGAVVGVTELDTRRSADEGAGWISLCYIERAERRRLLGVQLLGHAVSLYRALGRRVLRLSVSGKNAGAIAFYRAYDFNVTGMTGGARGPLLIMEKDLD